MGDLAAPDEQVLAPASTAFEIADSIRELLRMAPAVHAALAGRLRVGVSDVIALDHVTAGSGAPGVGELGQLLGMRSASATVLVDRLAANGHLERRAHGTDRRRVTLHPTDTARTEVRTALRPLVQRLGEITETLDDASAAVVLGFLRDTIAALADYASA